MLLPPGAKCTQPVCLSAKASILLTSSEYVLTNNYNYCFKVCKFYIDTFNSWLLLMIRDVYNHAAPVCFNIALNDSVSQQVGMISLMAAAFFGNLNNISFTLNNDGANTQIWQLFINELPPSVRYIIILYRKLRLISTHAYFENCKKYELNNQMHLTKSENKPCLFLHLHLEFRSAYLEQWRICCKERSNTFLQT